MALLNGLMEADVSPIHISRRRPIKDQSHQQPSFGDYFYAMTMSSNHSKRRDKYEQYLADEDEFDLHERAKRRRILIGYASAIATIATTSVLSTSGKALSIHRGRVPGARGLGDPRRRRVLPRRLPARAPGRTPPALPGPARRAADDPQRDDAVFAARCRGH